MRILLGLVVLAGLVSAPTARAQNTATVDLARFDQADRRARALLSSMRCAQAVGMARARREFGPTDSLGRIGECIAVDGRNVGVFLDADSPYVAVKHFSAVDLSAHTRRTAPLDTSRVLAVVRAEQGAYWHDANTAFEKEKRPFAPLAFRFDGDSIEVWLIPATLVMGPPFTIGGERGYLFTPDGRTLVRETDAFGDYRPIVIPDTGAVNIASRGTTVPSLSELVLANGLNGAGRSVAIQWADNTSALVGRGDQAVWMHLPRNPTAVGYSAAQCPSCAEWNTPAAPVHLFGNVWYVGTRGLSAILLTSDSGHVLIDGGLPESAALIMANVRTLGFRMEDIRAIVNSHAHYDHAGGIAAIQRASGARVAATLPSALVLRSGTAGVDDPQHDIALSFPRVAGTDVRVLADGDTVRVGPVAIAAHRTAGHTPGGTSWSWRSCEGTTCLDFVYADSQTPVSADGFLFTRNTTYPTALQDFAHGFAVLEQLPCDVLLTPHPGASQMWERLARRDHGEQDALRDPQACRQLAANARAQLAKRVAAETQK